MKIERLENGQVVLSVSKEQDYVQIKKYEKYEEVIDKATISAITEDMYVDWEVSERCDSIEEFLDIYHQYCGYSIYTDDDVLRYRKLIRRQDDFGEIEPNKKYYDNRIIIDVTNKGFAPSRLIEYDKNDSQIPQKSKRFPFWIEVHCLETREISIHICCHANIVRISEGNICFILSIERRYVFLEAYRILAILVQSKALDTQTTKTQKRIQEEFKICTDEYTIKKAFGLIADEYDIQNITKNEGEYAYLIRPVDNNTRVSIEHIRQYGNKTNNEHVEHKNVFELYKLNFEKCDFKDELVVPKLPSVRASFKNCTFEKEVKFNEAKFIGETLFQKSTFKDRVDFMDSQFGEENSRIDFSGATFEQFACFQRVTFHGRANFNGAIFNGEADFQDSNFNGLVYFSTTFSKRVLFSRAIFNKTADFQKAKFLSDADFSNSTLLNEKSSRLTTFMETASFQEAIFEGNTNFSNAHFQGKVNFKNSHFQKEATFIGASFDETADFYKATFKDKLRFVDSSFNKQVYFIESTFNDYAYFDETLFSDISDFSQSKFDKTAYFAGTKFQGFPIFLKTTFNESMSFTNAELNFDFDNVEDGIIKIYNDRMKTYKEPLHDEPKIEPYKYKAANELRDTFRAIKGTLIKDNNLLDASQFHRVELYCKEIEIRYRRKEKARNSGIRDVVDKIHLMLYRLTSDHHTDLLLIFNNMLALIVLFGAFVYGLCCFAGHDKIKENGIEKTVYYLHSLMTNSFCPECGIGNIVWCEVFSIVALCLIFAIVFLLMVAMFYCINTRCKHLGCWFIVVFLINAIILAAKPAIMLPIFGKLIDESLKIDFPAFTSLSVVYAILMFLLIWSLQKTARKNTIVPN